MENQVIFRDRQEMQAADFNNLQQFTRDSIDHVVNDAVTNVQGYAGFGVTKTANTQVTVAIGRYYSATGAVYPVTVPTVIDLFSNLPLVTQKVVAIVTWGTDQQTDVQPRDFLIDPTTSATEPQSVAMRAARQGQLSVVAGIEGPQPAIPTTDSTVTVVAYVLLATTGIVSITQNVPTQVPNLTTIEGQVNDLDAWEVSVSAQLDSLATALATISAQLKGFALETEIQSLNARLNELINEVNSLPKPLVAPTPWTFYGATYFLDNTNCDTGNGSFACVIEEGIKFPNTNSVLTLALLNSFDPNVVVNNHYAIPPHTNKVRMSSPPVSYGTFGTGPFMSSLSTNVLRRSRFRHRFGVMYQHNRSADWWKVGGFDPVTGNLALIGETFNFVDINTFIETINPADPFEVVGSYTGARRDYFWEDYYSEPYWDRVVTTEVINGYQYAQTFLNAQDGWLTQIGAYWVIPGTVDVRICHVDANNTPDLNRCIYSGSWSASDQTAGFTESVLSIVPTFLKAGTWYAVVFTTTAAGTAIADTFSSSQNFAGAWYYRDNSTHQWVPAFNSIAGQNDGLAMKFYFASFAQNRYELLLQPLQLAGGITGIDILTEAQVPASTSLTYQVQFGGVWYPLGIFSGVGPDLSTAPALLPMRAVFQGTTDLMPGLGLETLSQITVQRCTTSFTFISTNTVPAAPVTQVKVSLVLEGFNDTPHDVAVKVKEGSNTHTADSVVDTTNPDGSIQRDSFFNFSGAKASGTITFGSNPSNNDTVTIGGTVVTLVTGTPTGNQVKIDGSTLAATLQNLLLFLSTTQDINLRQATYAASGTVLTITYNTPGTVGNSYTLAASVATRSGATLTGGVTPIAITTYHLEIDGSTTSSGNLFHVSEMINYAK